MTTHTNGSRELRLVALAIRVIVAGRSNDNAALDRCATDLASFICDAFTAEETSHALDIASNLDKV